MRFMVHPPRPVSAADLPREEEVLLVELENPFPDTDVVYAQVMLTSAGTTWVPKQSIRKTWDEAHRNYLPGSMCDANQGIFEFNFGGNNGNV